MSCFGRKRKIKPSNDHIERLCEHIIKIESRFNDEMTNLAKKIDKIDSSISRKYVSTNENIRFLISKTEQNDHRKPKSLPNFSRRYDDDDNGLFKTVPVSKVRSRLQQIVE